MDKRDVILTSVGAFLLGVVLGFVWVPLAFLPAALIVLYLGLFA